MTANRRKLGRLAIAASVVALVAIAVTLLIDSQVPTQTAVVDRGPVGKRIIARGEVVSSRELRHVYPGDGGVILRFAAREGDRVTKGQVLAELERGTSREAVIAPEAGVIVATGGAVGDYARAAEHSEGAPLFVIADQNATELRVEVEAGDADRIAVGQEVSVGPRTVGDLHGDRGVPGHIARVAARLEPRRIGASDARVRADGLVRLATVTWDGDPPSVPLGAQVEATIEVGPRNAVTRLPLGAITVRDGRMMVALPGSLLPRRVPVEVLRSDGGYAEIRGLAEGTRVLLPR